MALRKKSPRLDTEIGGHRVRVYTEGRSEYAVAIDDADYADPDANIYLYPRACGLHGAADLAIREFGDKQ